VRVDVLWTPQEWSALASQGRVAVVVDVLRSASTIVTALANGARAVLPAASTEEALQIARSLGRDGVLLCGEQRHRRIEGFDLGNSPSEFRREVVEGRTLVLHTTNGTATLLAVADARAVWVLSFLNLSAVVSALLEEDADLALVCAGRSGLVGLDDVWCAGAAVARLAEARPGVELGDGAVAAHILWAAHAPVDAARLAATAAGRALAAAGLAADLEECARTDAVDLVPVVEGRKVVARRPGGSGPGGRA
jgi:2-phosphosulfolactate phosphatase